MQERQNSKRPEEEKISDERFVQAVIDRCKRDKGMAARLRRADNPAMEYQSWEFLGLLEIDFEQENKRLPYVTIAAAIAKSKSEYNGRLTLGQAIASCYEDGRNNDQAKMRLRRLLACDELSEVCRLLRPIFALIDSKVSQPLNYERLLQQLRLFTYESGQGTKTQWAQEFYRKPADVSTEDKEI